MLLKNKLFLIILFFIKSVHAVQSEFPELIAKQANENLRLLSSDGKFTYYQKRSGGLLFSTNYKVFEIIKSVPNTQYTLFSTRYKKKIAVSEYQNYNNYFTLRKLEKIYTVNYGEYSAKEIGMGISPQLHLDDNWLSYYDFFEKTLKFEHTINSALKFKIKTSPKINPYYVPPVIMTDDNTAYYIDMNQSGMLGLVRFTKSTSKIEVLHSEKTPLKKMELIFCKGKIFIFSAGINKVNSGTSIYEIDPKIEFNKLEKPIYSSLKDDIGQLTCSFDEQSLYFIKNTSTDNINIYTEIAELKLNNKEVATITNLKTISSLQMMDGSILTFDKGKILIIKGENLYKNVDSFK